ncbi:hypothetical protein LO763_00640 [Glycomyces sp. A-F 0318]|uniref:hypothetical protein n=1 Tax=Glycomyces amatae TaxID=2881355 RepID=UPI001E4042C5|nr:hypothetical protein [Glycomyces amatae]MCD0442132.1 hypothetical protein [Glycomyces amatae]
MSFTTIPQLTLPENRPTPSQGSLSRYSFRTAPYDAFDPGPWPWRPTAEYRRDIRTGRHRRDEAPDPLPTTGVKPGAAPTRRPSPRPAPPADPFVRLREQAWARFLEGSAPLARAHTAAREPERRSGLRSALVRWARRFKARIHRLAPRPSPS